MVSGAGLSKLESTEALDEDEGWHLPIHLSPVIP